MNEKAQDDREHVQAQLGGCVSQVLYTHDLTRNQEHDANGRVPGEHATLAFSGCTPSNHLFLAIIRLNKSTGTKYGIC